MVNQSPKKHPRVRREHNEISRSDWRLSPPCFLKDKGKSLGDPVDEVATLRVLNNLTEGTNKNGLRVRGKSQAPSRIDEHRNSLTPGRTTHNWVEVFREHELE
jgi:hypothetical protein